MSLNSTQKIAMARLLAQVTHSPEDESQEMIDRFMDNYTDQHDFDARSGQSVRRALDALSDEYNLDMDEEQMPNDNSLRHDFNTLSKQVSFEKQENHNILGKDLETVLSVYSSSSKLNKLKATYRSKLHKTDPSKAIRGAMKDMGYSDQDVKKYLTNNYGPNEQPIELPGKAGANFKKQLTDYHNYRMGVIRANRLLNWLNERRINTQIQVDTKDPSKLDVLLPENGNMQVTLMSDEPDQIGEVNTWTNKIGYDNDVKRTHDLSKMPVTGIVSALINPATKLTEARPFTSKAGKTFTELGVQGLDSKLFDSALDTNNTRPIDEENKAAKEEQEEREALGVDYEDDNGLDDDETNLSDTITAADKRAEMLKRWQMPWKKMDEKALEKDHEQKGIAKAILTQAKALNLQDVQLFKNDAGAYAYNYHILDKNGNPETEMVKGQDGKMHKQVKVRSGLIGGYIPPEKDGSRKVQYNGKVRGYSVPGMRGYVDVNTGDLRVKSFNSVLYERIRKTMADELMNPKIAKSPAGLGALDNLYTTDSYSTMIQKGVNSKEYEDTLIKTLSRRVRLDDDLLSAANAYNEDPDHVKNNQRHSKGLHKLLKNNARKEMMETRDLRTIPKEWQNVVDREMTGIGKTMGASLFIGDDVQIDTATGKLTPDPKNPDAPAKSALHKLPLMDFDKYDPADRNIMAFNQLVRNVPIDKVNVAMMTMSGYTENDAAVVTAKYANDPKHMVPDEDNPGHMRPLKRGDKISDLHGNKSTISEVIDPNEKDPERRKKLAREIAIVKANPDLDVVVNPYSTISRLNTGSAHEIQSGKMKQMNSPKEFPDIDLSNVTMGQENYVVAVGQKVDEKTKVYDADSFAHGKARHFSHQLAAAMASADLPKTLQYVYGNSTSAGWPKFFDAIRVMGYDVDKDHNIGYFDYNNDDVVTMKMPTKEEAEKNAKLPKKQRDQLKKTAFKDAFAKAREEASKDGKNRPIVMELPTSFQNAAGRRTDRIVVPTAQIDADAKLASEMGVDKSKSSMALNDVKRIFNAASGLDPKQVRKAKGYESEYDPKQAARMAMNMSNKIVAKNFSSHSNVVKNEIYSAPMKDSATTVITPDPNLDIDEIAVGPKVYQNLHLKNKDESVLMWRDPILRDGGVRFMHVKEDPTLTGTALNPVIVKSMDADFDGDTTGIVPIHDKEAQKELEKIRPSKQLLDTAMQKPTTYLETGLELQGSLYRQGDKTAQADLNSADVTPETVRAIVKKGFDSDKAYGIGLDLRDKESYLHSVSKLIESGAKGHYEKDSLGQPERNDDGTVKSGAMVQVEHYYDGNRTDDDMHQSMIGLAVKADGVGPAGRVQQLLLGPGRDIDPKDVMDFTYRPTQSTLQAKHDGAEAKKRIHAVLGPIPHVIAGQYQDEDKNRLAKAARAKGKRFNPNDKISNERFKLDADKIFNQELGLGVSTNLINNVANLITNKDGKIMSNKERRALTDPIDDLAYGKNSARTVLDNAIDSKRKIAVGRYSKDFMLPEKLASEKVLGVDYNKDAKQNEVAKANKAAEVTKENAKETNKDSKSLDATDTMDLPF